MCNVLNCKRGKKRWGMENTGRKRGGKADFAVLRLPGDARGEDGMDVDSTCEGQMALDA
jgi:hypothetical protein